MSHTPGTVEERRTPAAPLQTVPCTFYAARGSNDLSWRAGFPAKALGAKLVEIPEEAFDQHVLNPNENGVLPWTFLVNRNDLSDYEVTFPEHEGPAAVWIRPDPARALLASEMREQGILVVGEVDDNYLSKPELNIALREMKWKDEERQMHARSLLAMDRVVFSTEVLRDIYYGKWKQMYNVKSSRFPELHVCRNNIAYEDWPTPVPRTGPLRVGWAGSQSHLWDINLAYAALMHAQALGCETHLIGYNPVKPWGSNIGSEWVGQSEGSKQMIAQWKRLRFRHTPWRDEAEYHANALPFDIGLCPLRTDQHTLGKSDVKAIEYAISGAAVVAQNNAVYNKFLRHGETALLVDNPEQMAWAVDILVHDEELRLRLTNNLRKQVYEERGTRQLQEEWGAAVAPS